MTKLAEKFRSFLEILKAKNRLAYFNGQQNEIVTYCPWCESDSRKRHAHLYISLENPLFYCQRCNTKGVISKLLEALNITEINLSEFYDLNGKKQKAPELVSFKKDLENLLVGANKNNDCLVENDDLKTKYKEKIEYLQKRLNSVEDEESILKIPNLVLNVRELINKYSIDSLPMDLETLDKNYVGFLSYYRTLLILRRINDDESLLRYLKIRLIESPVNDYYAIKTKPLDDSTPVIVVGEGVFDILSPIVDHRKFERLIKSFNSPELSYPNLFVASLQKINEKVALFALDLLKCFAAKFIFLLDSNILPRVGRIRKSYIETSFKNKSFIINYSEILLPEGEKDYAST